ncbi:MAG: ABC transporter ATP-binding protein [Oscillospiraceae bacterium]|nr:ABC transporter ATP-binding protein [Oscillospiraceae bacterium]
MLEIRGINKTFNPGTVNENHALKDLSLDLADGESIAVIGGNGAGKSTLLNAVAGVWSVDSGSIRLGGVDITHLPEYKRAKYIGRVFQDPMMGTAANMQIEENLALAARRGGRRSLRAGITKAEREQFRDMLRILDLGLENRLTDKAGLLSGGQRQALTLLMASMQKPKLLLLDEHTAALDPKTAAKVMEVTRILVNQDRLTTLMITHNMRDAIEYADRLIMMYGGRIAVDVSGEEKKNLTVERLLNLFSQVSGSNEANDKLLLG